MAKYIFKRILTAIPLIIVITILCFSLIHLAPYDAIDAMTTPKMSPEMVQMIREKYGYDQPVYVQYIRWLEGILNGNFGYSIVTKTNIYNESKLDELRSERGTADSRMEALKAELAAATQRADTAEAKRREADEQLETIKKKTASFQSTQRESQKNGNIWQLKCHDLQQQVDELQKQLTAARALNTAAAPAAPTSDLVREAKLEAGKILADARLYAESAERELKQQAETQKNRMAENARSIASGVMLVRERLARVDERLSAATLDLDGLTQAIYQALDQTEAELKDLGTDIARPA